MGAAGQLGWDIDALTGHIEFPAVIGTAQTVFFVAPEPQRNAAMGAEFFDESEPALGVAERDQLFRQELDSHRRTIGLGKLAGEQRRYPVAAEKLAHGRSGTGLGKIIVLFLDQHGGSLVRVAHEI